MKTKLIQISLTTLLLVSSSMAKENTQTMTMPNSITINNLAQNPEGIEYDKNDHTFLLSSLNAAPVAKVNTDGSYSTFTSGEKFPLPTAGLQIDYAHNRLLVAGFNGTELMDKDPKTKGVSFLRSYNLKTGVLEKEVNLSSLVSDADAYFANDVAVDDAGNAYVSDWYAKVIYKVTPEGKVSIFWKNDTAILGGINGLDFHKDGYILASLLTVNEKGLYDNYGLVKIPVNDPKAASIVDTSKTAYAGFDGMVINNNGNVVGVTNNQKSPGGNTLMELSSEDNWKSTKVVHSKEIKASTTLAITPENQNYVIHQDFTDNFKKNWTIEKIVF